MVPADDDIDDIERIANERRARELNREGRYYHREPSDPPPDSGEPISKSDAVELKRVKKLELKARRADALKKISGAIASLAVVASGAATWAWNHAQTTIIQSLSQRVDPLCLRLPPKEGEAPPPGLSDRLTKDEVKLDALQKSIEAPTNPSSQIGQRLDSLDKILQKQFGESTKTTAPPSLGPTAHQRGQQ